MSVLDALKEALRKQRSLYNVYNANRQAAAAKRSKYTKRIRELESIKRDINRSLDNCADDVRKQQQRTHDRLGDGVRKHAHTGELAEAISNSYEQTTSSDSLCSQMIAEIDAEISRCRGELENADQEYRRAENNINVTNSNIRTINNKIREEQAKGGSR